MPDVEAIYPLSPQQQGMLFDTLASRTEGLFIEQLSYRLSDPIDPATLDRAWRMLVDRHAALRTAFVWRDRATPLQVVVRRPVTSLAFVDLRSVGTTDIEGSTAAFLAADRERGFDLGRAPLTRLTLVRSGERQHVLVWTQHHVLMDGWCMSVLLEELGIAYRAAVEDRPLSLPPVRPFRDYIAWLTDQDFTAAEEFWRKELADADVPTLLGQEIEAAPPLGTAYADEQIDLDAYLTGRIDELARTHHVTASTVVTALWSLLLSRYSSRDDVILGTTVSGRSAQLKGIETMIGLFMTTLPLRVRLSGEQAFSQWLGDVQERHVAVRRYEYCSLAQVHAWLELPGSKPLVESVLVFENYPTSSNGSGAGAGFVGARTRHPLTLLVLGGERMRFHAIFDEARMDRAGVRARLEHLQRLVVRATEHPTTTIAALRDAIGEDEVPHVHPPAATRDRAPYVAPETQTQRAIARLWEQLLDVNRIGADDDFFALGGQSLAAAQLLGRLQRAYAIELPLRTLFEKRTLRALAEALEDAVLSEVEAVGRAGPNDRQRR